MAETLEYTGPNGRTELCRVIEERPTGTTLRNVVTGETAPGVRLLLEPVDGDGSRFWSVPMRRVVATTEQENPG